jgi:hypothetical protein
LTGKEKDVAMAEKMDEMTDAELDILVMRHIMEAYGARKKLDRLLGYLLKETGPFEEKTAILDILQEEDDDSINLV